MEYKVLVLDFAERTRKNLEFIEQTVRNNPDAGIFEVTQLINSLLGLIIFPKERYFDHIPAIPLEQLQAEGWVVPKVKGNFAQVGDLRQLMGYLRNSIAHSNLKFISEGEILTGIRLWNCYRGQKTWEVELTLLELRDLANRFIDLIINQGESGDFVDRVKCRGGV